MAEKEMTSTESSKAVIPGIFVSGQSFSYLSKNFLPWFSRTSPIFLKKTHLGNRLS